MKKEFAMSLSQSYRQDLLNATQLAEQGMLSPSQQEEQKENRKLCGRCYNKKYADYICVDAMGNLLKPDYLSNSFQIILQNYHLRRIRFHDLRHSCASLLLANGVPMKMIQEWLGHSDFSTTANIYSHLDYASKVSSAEAMLNGLGMGSNPGNDT